MNKKTYRKILLLQPPIRDFYETDIRLQPLGLCHLKACCEQKLPGTVVTVRDYHSGYNKKNIPLPTELAYLKAYYTPEKSPFSTFSQYYHFGADFAEILTDIKAIAPELIGISALFSAYCKEALELARLLKKTYNIPILFGGAHVSARPEEVLQEPAVDFVIIGEGERPFVKLIECLQNNQNPEIVPNLGYKKNGQIFFNQKQKNYELTELPDPDFSDLKQNNYRYRQQPLSFMLTTRGCPYKCRFCSVHNTFCEGFRTRNIAQIIAEMKKLYLEGIRVFDFEDDNINYDKNRYKELLFAIIENFSDSGIQLMAMNGMAWHKLDKEILLLMKKAGFSHLNIALVSADNNINREMKRPWDISNFAQITEISCELGFLTTAYCICGLPQDRIENMLESLVFLAHLPVLIGVSPFYRPPGCELDEELSADGYPQDDYSTQARMTALNIFSQQFDRDDIFTIFVLARIINFLKSFSASENSTLTGALDFLGTFGKRSLNGVNIIRNLQNNISHHPHFKITLFREFMRKTDHLSCLNGSRIYLHPADNK